MIQLSVVVHIDPTLDNKWSCSKFLDCNFHVRAQFRKKKDLYFKRFGGKVVFHIRLFAKQEINTPIQRAPSLWLMKVNKRPDALHRIITVTVIQG